MFPGGLTRMVRSPRLAAVVTVFVAAIWLSFGCGTGRGPDISGDWVGHSNLEGDRLGVELSLNLSEDPFPDTNTYGLFGDGTITSFESGNMEEDFIQFGVSSGSISEEGEFNLTGQLEGGRYQIDLTGNVGAGSIEGRASIYDGFETFGGTFEVARGEAGAEIRQTALSEERTVRDQQRAAEDISELEESYGEALYAHDGEFYGDALSVETATESLENAAIELEETFESTYGADIEQRESDNAYVQSVLADFRAGKESQQSACESLSYDRSDYSQSDGISNDTESAYREAESGFENSERQLSASLENARELLAGLQAAGEAAGGEAPDLRYTEEDLRELEEEAETVREEARTKAEEVENRVAEYERRAEEASDQAVAAYDEMDIIDSSYCWELSEEMATSEPEEGEEADPALQSLVSEYYVLVAADDYAATYPYLDDATQAEFTEEEWIEAQQQREVEDPIPPATSASVVSYSVSGEEYQVEVLLNHEDGTQQTRNATFVLEDGEFRRRMSEASVEYLKGLL